MSQTAIRITRVSATVRDRLRGYRVELDGSIIGKIRSGKTIDFPAEPGQHRLRIKADVTGSQVLSFDLRAGQTRAFECQPNGHSLSAVVAQFTSVDNPGDTWVDLRDVTDEPRG
ncbi:MAG TPA: hypothetical protein VHV57_00665 [Acidimicrobiales bacterium]|jgi:hypothetical protein|nr:hypothetical protein [Acidimicrobiales bacterium]